MHAGDFSDDPHAEREAARYQNPVASRELILATLQQQARPLTMAQLAHHFAIHDDPEREEALRRRLVAMERDGQLMANRRGAYVPMDESLLIEGRVQGHVDGFGWLIPLDGSSDLLLSSKEMRLVFDGDTVLAREAGYDHKGRREARIVRVKARGQQRLVGRVCDENGEMFVVPDNPRICHDILLQGDLLGAEPGQFVTLEITSPPTHRDGACGRVVEVLGDFMAPGMEIDIALRNFDIPHVWPEAVLKEAEKLPEAVRQKDLANRLDLRELPLVTIDGEDARDFDDAVYAEKRRGGFRLVVAIADVSWYVRPGSALDTEAAQRGNSVYFPQHVVPMLPEQLSNGLCSLNPHVDRLCLVCDMTISLKGRVTSYQFHSAVMHSQARLTYTQVAAYLQREAASPDAVAQQATEALMAMTTPTVRTSLDTLHALYKVLRAAREVRGALDFDSTETRIIFDDQRKIARMVPVTRNEAHMLIEECMLSANVCAAELALEQSLPVLFRNHHGPREEKLQKLRRFLALLGLDFTASMQPEPADLLAVIEQIHERPDAGNIQTMILRSMTQAVYQSGNEGHFGLAYKAYAHFTSPIRRYPDLLLHRALRLAIGHSAGTPPEGAALEAMGQQCSMTERRADEATRDVIAWLKCEYMQEHVGEEFDGIIAGVTSFGFFVTLSEIYVDGLVHVSNLKDDYYRFDEVQQRLVGERSGLVYALGDAVRVSVAAVNLDERKIDFDLVDGGRKARRGERAAPAADRKTGTGKKGAGGTSGAGKAHAGKHGTAKSSAGKRKTGKSSKGHKKK